MSDMNGYGELSRATEPLTRGTQYKGYEPTQDRCLVRRDPKVCAQGGIVIPEQAQIYGREAEVLAVGPQVVQIQPGDRVLTAYGDGSKVEIDGEDVFVILEKQIFVITPK